MTYFIRSDFRLCLTIALALMIVVSARSTRAAGSQGGTSKSVFAAALSADGTPITGLAKTDWGVREDGTDRVMIDVKPATDPLAVALLVDITKGTESTIGDVRSATAAFVAALRAGSPGVAIALTTVAGSATTPVDFGKPAGDLDRALQRLFPDSTQNTTFLEAIIDAAKRLNKASTPRRAIVALNLEGFPEASSVPPANVASAVIGSGASLWAVSYRNNASATTSVQGGQARDLIFNALTTETGGMRRTIGAASAIAGQMKAVADTLLAQYVVTYTRPDGPTPKVLQMAVARSGAQVLLPRNAPK
jgi:hypothetical protein